MGADVSRTGGSTASVIKRIVIHIRAADGTEFAVRRADSILAPAPLSERVNEGSSALFGSIDDVIPCRLVHTFTGRWAGRTEGRKEERTAGRAKRSNRRSTGDGTDWKAGKNTTSIDTGHIPTPSGRNTPNE